MSSGPCLCGDTACGSCHPEGQTRMRCPECGWTGKLCDAGFVSDEDEEHDVYDACPHCGSTLQVADSDGPEDPVEQPDDDQVVDGRSQFE